MNSTINFILKIKVLLVIQMFVMLFGYSQNTFPENVQYKKHPTDAIALIAQGNPDKAIDKLETFLAQFPNDAESHYCMAVAFSVKNKIPLAMESFKKSMEFGMPIERFLSGPDGLLKKLVDSKVFNEYIQGRYTKLVHGPMLGDISPTTAKIWLRTDRESKVVIHILEEGKDEHKKFKGLTLSSKDYTSVIQISGLEPATSYIYNIYIDESQLFENGTFTTTENRGKQVQLKIGFGGGAGYTPWYERMWDTLAKQSFDAFLLLGDNVYIDYPTVPEAQKYCYYRRQSRPEFRRFPTINRQASRAGSKDKNKQSLENL